MTCTLWTHCGTRPLVHLSQFWSLWQCITPEVSCDENSTLLWQNSSVVPPRKFRLNLRPSPFKNTNRQHCLVQLSKLLFFPLVLIRKLRKGGKYSISSAENDKQKVSKALCYSVHAVRIHCSNVSRLRENNVQVHVSNAEDVVLFWWHHNLISGKTATFHRFTRETSKWSFFERDEQVERQCILVWFEMKKTTMFWNGLSWCRYACTANMGQKQGERGTGQNCLKHDE